MTGEQFDALSVRAHELTGRPWDGTTRHLTEVHLRQAEILEVLQRHNDWLSRLRARAEGDRQPWTTAELRRQSRLDGDTTVVPEWIASTLR